MKIKIKVEFWPNQIGDKPCSMNIFDIKFGPNQSRMLKLRIDKDLGRYPFQSYTYNSDLNFSRSRI